VNSAFGGGKALSEVLLSSAVGCASPDIYQK
jgi:hypothetical protein